MAGVPGPLQAPSPPSGVSSRLVSPASHSRVALADLSSGSKSAVSAAAAMKVPVAADGKLCNICYMDEHEAGMMGVACDNDHFVCSDCFAEWVSSAAKNAFELRRCAAAPLRRCAAAPRIAA